MTWLKRLFGWGANRREADGQPSAPPPAQPAAIPVIPFGEAPSGAPPSLTARDMQRLQGVHPDLVKVVKLARGRARFFVAEGLRSRDRQAQLVADGKSKTMNSRHLTGHAVDLYPVSDTPIPEMTKADFHAIAEAMRWAAAVEKVPLAWGGDWRTFVDAPHWELSRGSYP